MSDRRREKAAMTREQRLTRIWETIADIPRGKVASYGQIAEIAGIPRGARQVAYALRHAPDALQLPWFRVVQAAGTLAFDKGSAPFRRQSRLLQEEGVSLLNGRIDMPTYRWQPDLDELLWKPSAAWDEDDGNV
jgi:methylated-DNA-protein-cysteine methyltransferase-like protein